MPLVSPWSVAPLTDRTDRHFRALVRCIAPTVRLYSEMVVAVGDLRRLTCEPGQSPVAAQLAGSEPSSLAAAARLAEQRGFDSIDLNCGCPSAGAVAGGYGAVLMRSPDRVAQCVAAIGNLPVSIKCRIGTFVGPREAAGADHGEALRRLVEAVVAAGCRHITVHARSAALGGLSTCDNRRVPPLHYDVVHALAVDHPELDIELNGGIVSLQAGQLELSRSPLSGIMIGRAAYDDPLMLAGIERPGFDRIAVFAEVVDAMASRIDAQLRTGTPAWALVRHMLGLPRGLPGGKRIRTAWAQIAHQPQADGRTMAAAAVLSAAPAARGSDTFSPPGA